MKRLATTLTSFSLLALCCLALALATERPAYAYIDPGTGYIALQSAAAALAAGVYFLRRRIGALFGRKTPSPTPAPTAPASALNSKETSRAA